MENIIEANPRLCKFGDLRQEIWIPKFKWVSSLSVAADIINSWHEDYPKYVKNTESAIKEIISLMNFYDPLRVGTISNNYLNFGHKYICNDKYFAGHFREVNVIVGQHIPPRYENIERLMENFEEVWGENIIDIDSLISFYSDLMTIHPWQDFNGRCGGTFVAAFSNIFEPEKGYLAALQ